MSKTLTEELILKRLKDKGVTVPNETSQTDQLAQIMISYGCSIVTDWQSGCDAFFYTETTADDYEVFVATTDERTWDYVDWKYGIKLFVDTIDAKR